MAPAPDAIEGGADAQEAKTLAQVGPQGGVRAGLCLIIRTLRSLQLACFACRGSFHPSLSPHPSLPPPPPPPQVIVTPKADLIGQTIRDSGFRGRFDAAVIAVKRDNVKQGGRLGDVVLRKGDVLVLSVGTRFDSKAEDFTKNFRK